ncbi:MAG: cyclohexa-1,5-dienecarbonyl-CoA hydratase [Betaproteobacteria bacterium RIFCSPLOWO2_12_FULL_63_13]|nr:MAG: cyclohexa-1,5-dienecarbonyl-CoA hydratase [Betaproteobacteria bacterium RIFCSPLOWO2_02_FULL_63_19]OGA46670.1 MAG: cyclohexa-1,5-dienecarbonyl-CoA hydratase [Betaproteobacteria bacterium RIFCSPLOWO2_12_FULL_63_13]
MTDQTPLKVWLERDGALLRLRLARPKANIVDAAMIAALRAAFAAHRDRAGLLAAILDAEGPHFSFGASVEEHLPETCAQMLSGLHAMVIEMLEWPAPILVAVRGQCLGGGLELAMAGSQIFVAQEAKLGQPEIQLAVFAPAASCLLPARVGQGRAEDLLFSGRSIDAAEAVRIGLATAMAADPEAAALEYFDKYFATRSAAALAVAVSAARGSHLPEVKRRLAEVERLYVERTIKTRDANEGLNAFIAKRAPKWEHC